MSDFEHPQLQVKIPMHLKELFLKLETLKRFIHEEFPDNVFRDNVMIHTIRCVNRANTLDTPGTKKITEILFVHDIPELITGDIDVIKKLDHPKKYNDLTTQEDIAIKTLLNNQDQVKMIDFNYAKAFLKGEKHDERRLSSEALISVIIDGLDGNMAFHHFLSRWLKSPAYDSSKLPPARAGLYAVVSREKNIKAMSKIKSFSVKIPLQLIDETIIEIKKMWKSVPDKRIPASIAEGLEIVNL